MRLRVFVVMLMLVAMAEVGLAAINKPNYDISISNIDEIVKIGDFKETSFSISNSMASQLSASISTEGNVSSLVKIRPNQITLDSRSSITINVTLLADYLGNYSGLLLLRGGIQEQLPIKLQVSAEDSDPVEALSLSVSPVRRKIYLEEPIRFKVDLHNLLRNNIYNVSLTYTINKDRKKGNKSLFEAKESLLLDSPVTIIKEYYLPENISLGEYYINVTVSFDGLDANAATRFFVGEKFMEYPVLGIVRIKYVIYTLSIILPLLLGVIFLRKYLKGKKRYKSELNFSLLPKKGDRGVRIGRIAETTKDAFFDIDQLTIHTLIAGSTGGGKTVSAEVLIEECLMKNVTVFVFDPTAQWSGFLRKNTSKKMFEIYKRFNMKKTEARAFNGNVHQILDARQIIDIKKYLIPGEIHVFAINKLDPKDADILAANTIREVFHASLPEAPQLILVIIFDEVHRLLPKFGGSGQGFLQIERGCREFRKWGVGLILISQVLTDFVGETKANINTEIQMRTRDQGDLERIKNKYGGYMLQSLLKSATGTGMLQNASYNKGNPYFVAFRPLLHEHARLSDEELDNYNKYNDKIDNIDYSIKQLEEEGIDTFDMKLELKMALDKVKAGSFNMVDIYLQGLIPRIEEQWKKIGKQPKKYEIKLVDESELQAEFEAAKRARAAAGIKEPEQKKKEGPKLDPLKLSNGTSVGSITELIDGINTMEEDAAAAEKENIANWVKPIDEGAAKSVTEAKTKEEIIIALEPIQ